jgi:parallel beta-helix repeat protein
VASPNNITGNTYGIWVDGNSNAKILANTISGNTLEGIHLRQQAHAIVAGNNIGTNKLGIFIELLASVDLSDTFAGPFFLNSANNSNVGPNTDGGVHCTDFGAYVRGPIGSLTGSSFQIAVASPCLDLTF